MNEERTKQIETLYEKIRSQYPKDGDTITTQDIDEETWRIDDLSDMDEFFGDYEDDLENLNDEECENLIREYLGNNIYAIQDYLDDGVNIGMFTNWEIK